MTSIMQLTGAGLVMAATAIIPAFADPDLSLLKKTTGVASYGEISQSPISGLYELNAGSDVFYLSEDGRYLVQGDLFDLEKRENISDNNRAKTRLKMLEAVNKDDMIIFPAAEGKKKHVVYVFTDIDCGYCRMLHDSIKEYNNKGIEIRYLSFPRAGIGSESYEKAVGVWCAKDRNEALTRAKKGEVIESKSCNAPVRDQYTLGVSLGITGTPTIILEDGSMIPGFVKPDNLASILEQQEK